MIIITIAITTINTDTTVPVSASISCLKKTLSVSPKVLSIVDSNVIIDTLAAARLMILDAEYIGLLYLRYRTRLMSAIVTDAKV